MMIEIRTLFNGERMLRPEMTELLRGLPVVAIFGFDEGLSCPESPTRATGTRRKTPRKACRRWR